MTTNDSLHFDQHQKDFNLNDESWATVSDDFHEHPDEKIIKALFDFIQFDKLDLNDKCVFTPGCGTAYEVIPFAKRNAHVIGIDISAKQAEIATKRAEYNKCSKQCEFTCGDALATKIPDNSIDIIIAHAVIHHFDYDIAAKEFYRILKPGGFFIFSEPLAENPILNFVRNKIPYRDKHRTPDEHPLNYADIKYFTRSFKNVSIKELQFLSMLERLTGKKDIINTLCRIDAWLFRWIPFTKRLCRYVLIKGYK